MVRSNATIDEAVIDDIEEMIELAIPDESRKQPAFYAVSGSHLYGFPTPAEDGGDYDVRGFHTVRAREWAKLDQPDEQVIVNQGTVTDEFEDYAHIDFVSYELRKFIKLIYQANFNVLELLFCADPVMNRLPLALNALRDLIRTHLPMDVPRHYMGMARSNYQKFLDHESGSYRPTAKKYLYVIRGLLGARYIQREHDVVADIRTLADQHPAAPPIVETLIEVKRDDETAGLEEWLIEECDDLCAMLFNDVESNLGRDYDKGAYRADLDEWMQKTRS